ncbi:MAG: hypothetical protein D6678_08250 [Zetaproteobacteria bacterium]|nr:MAG: hypothetical protein D6678_08250 [Zetaproteobacteria bacterium]
MAKRWEEVRCALKPDASGVWWDLLLYVPTVTFLILWGLKFWYAAADKVWIGYALLFLGFFFLMVGGGRVLRRLLILPTSPVALDISRERVRLKLKNGEYVALVRELRFFADYAGKSFALTGLDQAGGKRQFIFHRKQFAEEDYARVVKALERYK